MLELKNVSKFYYKKGIVSSGISKVSLKFDMGEFIAITGENVSTSLAIRPVISLKSCVKYSSGDGSSGSPYTILETATIAK